MFEHLEERVAALDIEYEATQSSLRENQWKIHHFEEKFKELRDVSGLSSLDDIISTFVKNEDECFSIFNYIQAVNHDCDRTIEHAVKLREEINNYRHKEMEEESGRSVTMNVYKESLQEVELERETLCETAIEGRRAIESIAHRVTALFFKLKCHELKGDELTPKNSLPLQLQTDRKLTTIGGGEVSERNILNRNKRRGKKRIHISSTRRISVAKARRQPITVPLGRYRCTSGATSVFSSYPAFSSYYNFKLD